MEFKSLITNPPALTEQSPSQASQHDARQKMTDVFMEDAASVHHGSPSFPLQRGSPAPPEFALDDIESNLSAMRASLQAECLEVEVDQLRSENEALINQVTTLVARLRQVGKHVWHAELVLMSRALLLYSDP